MATTGAEPDWQAIADPMLPISIASASRQGDPSAAWLSRVRMSDEWWRRWMVRGDLPFERGSS